jgi:hypothetical protein
MFRILKHLLAAEACQARTEDAYYVSSQKSVAEKPML